MGEIKVICKLKSLMDEREISQLALAESTGLAPSTVGRLYRNQISRIDCQTVVALCDFFNLKTISDLIEIQQDKP